MVLLAELISFPIKNKGMRYLGVLFLMGFVFIYWCLTAQDTWAALCYLSIGLTAILLDKDL